MIKKYLQKRFINYLVKDLFNTITVDDILRIENGQVMYKGKAIEKEKLVLLSEDAERLKNSSVLKLILKEVKFISNEKMYNKSKTIEDILFGKASLWVVDIIQKKVDYISQWK